MSRVEQAMGHGAPLVGGPAVMLALGLLMAFNPCMLAMLPLAGAYAAGGGARRGAGPAIHLGFAGALALQGLAAGWVGGLLGGLQQALPYLLGSLYLVLGAYLLNWWGRAAGMLPVAFSGFYVRAGSHRRSTGLAGAASLGVVLGFTPAPCTTPVILAVLGYAAYRGDPWLAGLLLFCYGLGHGLPLAVAGTLGHRLRNLSLPWLRPAGGWALLALGVYFLAGS